MTYRSSLFFLAMSVLPMPAAQALPPSDAPAIQPQGPAMKASITYLHLLAKTPFFTKLTSPQLQWVIDHSKEWEVRKGTQIASSDGDPEDFWILLDGGWQLDSGGKLYPAGHADPGKWYGADAVHAAGVASRLTATEHGYVMVIRYEAFNEMLRQGFNFDLHLRQGEQYYAQLLGMPVPPESRHAHN